MGWDGEWWLSSKSVLKSSQEIFNSIFALPRRSQFFATLHTQIQNELVALQTLRDVAQNIQNTAICTIMPDLYDDASNAGQLVFFIRWTDEYLIRHDKFLGIHCIRNTSANNTADAIKDILLRMKLQIGKS